MASLVFKWFEAALVAVFMVLVGRVMVLTVWEGSYYRELAEGNRVEVVDLPADRGVMYDRNGVQLVRNTPEGREYIFGKALAHVLGHVGEISQFEGDTVGKVGLEKEYDAVLSGQDGALLVEKDAEGKLVREVGRKDPVAGESLELTVDVSLQQKAFQVLAGRLGAVIASDSQTGEILALVSGPAFDPNKVEEALADSKLPLFDRATSGEYPPGSVFKVVTATAGLEEGRVNESTQIEDTGEIVIGDFRYGNWYYDQYGRKEGLLNIVRAIARSNDIFFYKMGEALGITALSDWAKYFGVGRAVGIDLPGEANGLMPDPDWKQKYIGESWYLGDTYISAIGQGNILMTPLQVNQMMSIVASGGRWCRPHLVKSETNCQKLDISNKTIATVTEGLKQVTETGGTAWPFFDFTVDGERILVAGKTGTAEYGDPDDKTHAWFTAFAPADEPAIVVTVLLEGAGEGSNEAAPVAKELLAEWFRR